VTELEQRLAGLRDDMAWPPTPDIAGAVAARIAADPAQDRRRMWPALRMPGLPLLRPATVALAAGILAVAIAATLAASPGVRARVADWLGIGAVRVERVDRLPDVGRAGDLGLGVRTTVADARRATGLPVSAIAALGAPDAVYADRPGAGGAQAASVSVVYLARRGLPAATRGIGALLTVLPGGDEAVVKKVAGSGTDVQFVDVDGAFGVFLSGAQHVVGPPNRLAGNTLIWVRGDVTYRLESALGRDAALRLARSVR
jgi:hypothetical protein